LHLNAAVRPVASSYRADARANCKRMARREHGLESRVRPANSYLQLNTFGGDDMCVSCGCGKFEDSHGDERNISVSSLQRAAAASNLTVDQVLNNLVQGCGEMRQSGVPDHTSRGQAIESRLHPD
jgi:hypothetical protein